MKFINYTNDGRVVVQHAALILSKLDETDTLELHTMDNAIILLKKDMTLVETRDVLQGMVRLARSMTLDALCNSDAEDKTPLVDESVDDEYEDTLKRLPHLTMLGLRKKENEYTYAPCTKQQAEELIRGLREIVPYVVIDCSSYIANDILSAVALMEADSVLQLASCDLKSVGYLSSQLPLLGELKWDKDKQYRVASNIKPFQAADRIGQVLGSVVFRLPYSQELEEQYLAGELLADLSMKDSRAFRKEIDRICEEVF